MTATEKQKIRHVTGEELSNRATALSLAITTAAMAHDQQKDKVGKPYILHPLAVMLACETEEERIVAVLHDVFEDTDLRVEDLRIDSIYSLRVLAALDAITHREGETNADYWVRVKADPLALSVKRKDIAHNLSRLDGIPEPDQARMRAKWTKALAFFDAP